jgi:hypothetical protein
MSILLIIVLVVLLFGGGSYFYSQPGESGPGYPYRGFALPGLGTILFIFLVLYLLHII